VTNALLERAPVPTIWVANQIAQIDPATLRRFDLTIELRVPPRAVRRRILAGALERVPVDAALVERLAGDERMSPADATRAARVARVMGARTAEDATRTIAYVIDRNLAVRPARAHAARLACAPYDVSLVNASADLDAVTASLAR
jgi:AAA+ superfamily predicted ATPase